MTDLEDVKARIRTLTERMPHYAREGIALYLAGVAAGEPCRFVKCDRDGLAMQLSQQPEAIALSAADRAELRTLTDLALKRLDETGQERLSDLLRRDDDTRINPAEDFIRKSLATLTCQQREAVTREACKGGGGAA